MFSALTLAVALLAQTGPAPVPIENDPRHRQVFSNEHVRVFDVSLQPGEATSMHTHVFDSVGVKLGDARVSVELPDGSTSIDVVERGAVSFASPAAPVTHKVHNTGDTPFRTIVVELLQPSHGAASTPPATAAYGALIVDNERVRVSRTILAAGESTPRRTHELRGIRVVVRGEAEKPGDLHWHERGAEYVLGNHSPEPLEVVEIELKQESDNALER